MTATAEPGFFDPFPSDNPPAAPPAPRALRNQFPSSSSGHHRRCFSHHSASPAPSHTSAYASSSSSSNNNNTVASTPTSTSSSSSSPGTAPLLPSASHSGVKSYGTASDLSDAAAASRSTHSAIVITHPSLDCAGGPRADTAADVVDATTRVNEILANRAAHGKKNPHIQVPSSTSAYTTLSHEQILPNTSGGDSAVAAITTAPAIYSPLPQPPQVPQADPSFFTMRNDEAWKSGQGQAGKVTFESLDGTRDGSTPPPPQQQQQRDARDAVSGYDSINANGGGGNAHHNSNSPSHDNTGGALGVAAPPIAPSSDHLPSFSELVLHRVRTTSLLQFLWVLLLVVMLLVGNACQVIFLNFWIHQFPKKDTPPTCSSSSAAAGSGTHGGGSADPERAEALESSYTTFIISASLFAGFFIVLFILYWLWRRPSLKFAREGAGWRLLLAIGAVDTLNSGMAIYAAAHTPEVLQALFVSLVPIYSAFFTKWLLKDPRNYANIHVAISFALIMAGVGLASLFSYAATHQHDGDDSSSGHNINASSYYSATSPTKRGFVASHTPKFLFNIFADEEATSSATRDKQLWCLIFFLSVPPTVLMNVFQTMYMIRYTESDELTSYLLAHEGDAEETTVRTSVSHRRNSEALEEAHTDAHRGSGAAGGGHVASNSTDDCARRRPAESAAEDTSAAPSASSPRSSGSSGSAEDTLIEHQHRLHVPASELLLHGEDTAVKLVMLAADTTIQALMAFFLMPMDALPWFGGSDSIQEVWQNLDDGVACVLHCPRNMRYCILYSMGFVLVYIAAAYLNRYSVTLCSMVSQLSGPITALVLIAFPSLNMTGDAAPWYVSVFAVVLLSLGTVIYVYWDEMTGEEKASGEMQLKWAMMEEQARRHQPVDDGGESASSGGAEQQQQHHRRSRTRRYRRRRQSSYVVLVDHDPDVPPASQQ